MTTSELARGHHQLDTQRPHAPDDPLTRSHTEHEAHRSSAPGEPLGRGHRLRVSHPDTAPVNPLAGGQRNAEARASSAPGNPSSGDQTDRELQVGGVAGELDALLYIAAQALSDIEALRIATASRRAEFARAGIRIPTWQDAMLGALQAAEHSAMLDLQRIMRRHPLGPWVKSAVGVGEKQAARLLAAIGDPAWNALHGRPRRGAAELWAFCGYAPEQRKRRGESAAWNHEAKFRAYLIATSCIKHAHSPYRPVYDKARANWQDRDTTDGHKHNHALRLVAKEILKDLYLAAKEARQCST